MSSLQIRTASTYLCSLIITLLPALRQRVVPSAIKRTINIVLDYASLG
jgi:hypothetical protein